MANTGRGGGGVAKMESQKPLCSSLQIIIIPKSHSKQVGCQNFRTDYNHLGPGQNWMVGDFTAQTCTNE